MHHATTVSAIANYTTRVARTSLSNAQRQEALKFLGASPSRPALVEYVWRRG